MLPALLRGEVFKMTRRAMPRILLLILVAGVAGLYGVFWLVLQTEAGRDKRRDWTPRA